MTPSGGDCILSTSNSESRRTVLARTGFVIFGTAAIGATYPSATAFADGCDVSSLKSEFDEILSTEAGVETIKGLYLVIVGGVLYTSGLPLLGVGIMTVGSSTRVDAYKQVILETLDLVYDKCWPGGGRERLE